MEEMLVSGTREEIVESLMEAVEFGTITPKEYNRKLEELVK